MTTSVQSSSISLPSGRKISYRLSSPQDGSLVPIVLLSNSLMAPYPTWDYFVSHLLSHNYRVLCYDQVGHGDSTTDPATTETTTFHDLANDVRILLDTLEIKELYAFIGISMGAATGVYFSVQNPGRVKNLVLCDTIPHSAAVGGVPDVFEPRVQTAKKEGSLETLVEATLQRWFSEEWRGRNPEEVQRVRKIMGITKVDGFVACCRALQSKDFDLRPLSRELGKAVESVMIVVGELDANLPITMKELRDRIQEGFDDAGKHREVAFHVVKGAGHVCVVDGFEEYRDAVTSFFKA